MRVTNRIADTENILVTSELGCYLRYLSGLDSTIFILLCQRPNVAPSVVLVNTEHIVSSLAEQARAL